MVNQGAETIDAFEHFSTAHFIPPKQSFREFLYNKKAKTVLGRNGESWSKYMKNKIKQNKLEQMKL